MFERFKPDYEIHHCETHGHTDVLNFLIAIILMAKLINSKKIKLIWKLCDFQEKDYLTSEKVLEMLTRIEKIFCQEEAME